MRMLALWFVLAGLPIVSIAEQAPSTPSPPPPVPTMQNMPSQEQIFKLFQKRAAAAREGLRRFRIAMLAALNAEHRAAIGATISANALADVPDKRALVKAIDAILTENEREGVAAAMTAYMAEQEAMRPALEADFLREFPDLAKTAHPNPTQEPLETIPAKTSATILANWLLAPQPRPIETLSYAQLSTVTPFNWGGPDTAPLENRLRLQILSTLSEPGRSQIAKAFAEYVTSDDPDQARLAQRVNSILPPGERQRILDSYAKFAAAQKMAFSKSQEQLAAMRLTIPPNLPHPTKQGMEETSETAGEVLLQSLMGGARVTANFISGGDSDP